MHLQTWHGITEREASPELWHHGIIRAAVTFIMD